MKQIPQKVEFDTRRQRRIDEHDERGRERRTKLTPITISEQSVLSRLQQESCLDLRQLAARHGVDATDEALVKTVADLSRRGKIARIGGRGSRTSFVPATFEN